MSSDPRLIWLSRLLWSTEYWICTYYSLEFDFPALKFQWVREFSKKQFRDRTKSRVLHHTIQTNSSSSTIPRVQGCKHLIENVGWYGRTLRISSHPSTMFHNISRITWSQSARRWCQIPWILEESWGWSFSSRCAFKNVSWSTHGNSVYRAAIQGTRDAPVLLAVSGSASFKEFTLFYQILNPDQELTHNRRILSLFLRNRSFVISLFLGNFLCDFLGRFCFSFQFSK